VEKLEILGCDKSVFGLVVPSGYAFYAIPFLFLKPHIKIKIRVSCSLRSHEKGECGSFFGLCPKNEPPLLLFCERSEQKIPL
jgi:hypothetical protein